MLVDKFKLTPSNFRNEELCFYDNGNGIFSQLLSLRRRKSVSQSEMPRYPMVYKRLHVQYLTYSYKGNKYMPYIMANEVSKASKSRSLVSQTQYVSIEQKP